jgi:hypothetical protein
LGPYDIYIRLAAYLLGLAGIRDARNAVGFLENWCFERWGEIGCVINVTEIDREDKRILYLSEFLFLVLTYTIPLDHSEAVT